MAINPKAIRGPVTAVPVVAGKGVRFVEDVENNRVVAEVDETVLYNGSSATSVTCSEAITNFERLRVYVTPSAVSTDDQYQIVEMIPGKFGSYYILAGYVSNLFHIYAGRIANTGTTNLHTENGFHMWVPVTSGGTVGNESTNSRIAKVIGVNRVASA